MSGTCSPSEFTSHATDRVCWGMHGHAVFVDSDCGYAQPYCVVAVRSCVNVAGGCHFGAAISLSVSDSLVSHVSGSRTCCAERARSPAGKVVRRLRRSFSPMEQEFSSTGAVVPKGRETRTKKRK
jgi:hypothetical protein